MPKIRLFGKHFCSACPDSSSLLLGCLNSTFHPVDALQIFIPGSTSLWVYRVPCSSDWKSYVNFLLLMTSNSILIRLNIVRSSLILWLLFTTTTMPAKLYFRYGVVNRYSAIHISFDEFFRAPKTHNPPYSRPVARKL